MFATVKSIYPWLLKRAALATLLLVQFQGQGSANEFGAAEHRRRTIYHSPQTPGFTSWVGAWTMPDGDLMVSFTQATGPVTGRPQAPADVRRKLNWPPDGQPGYDMTGLDLRNVHLRSNDGGNTWLQVSADPFRTCMNGVTGEAQTALTDGTILRGVWGFYLPYDAAVPKTGYLERSTDGSRTWGKPEVLMDPAKYSAWPKRIRQLRDGRLIILGGVASAPANSLTRDGYSDLFRPFLLVSSDKGRTWTGPIEVVPEEHRKSWGGEEFDAAELPNGNLLCVFRRLPAGSKKEVRWQGVLEKSGDTWIPSGAGPAPFPHSGHPDLLATREGIVLHLATSGIHWTGDAGKSWHKLELPGTSYYPRGVQAADGTIHVVGHTGGDDPYGKVDQSIVMDSFRLIRRGVPTQNHANADLHLLVDDTGLERVTGLQRMINRPRKHPVPVLQADKPWEGDRAQAWGSVIVEPDGRFRMWYFAFNTERHPDELDRGGYAYAESRDGIHWTKPNLGVVEFRGSKNNNLFYTCSPDGRNLVDEELARRNIGLPALDEDGRRIGVINNLDGLTVVRDDDDPDPSRRYKLIANMQDHRMWAYAYRDRYPNVTDAEMKQARQVIGQYMDTSPDGIHWARKPRRISHGASGDYMMVTRDYRNGQWWLNERSAAGRGGRNAALRVGKTLERWSPSELIFDNGPDSGNGKIWQWHGGITPFNYGRWNLGFLERWPDQLHGATCELVSQAEGQSWHRVQPGTPILDVGSEGEFDRVLSYPTHNPPIRWGDQILIYYTGAGVRTNPRKGVPMAIGLMTLGRDRFAGLANWRAKEPGLIVTKPQTLRKPGLLINAELTEGAPLRVAVLAPDGKELAGFGLADSRMEPLANGIEHRVGWRHGRDLAELRGREVKLMFEVKGAIVYAYRWE